MSRRFAKAGGPFHDLADAVSGIKKARLRATQCRFIALTNFWLHSTAY